LLFAQSAMKVRFVLGKLAVLSIDFLPLRTIMEGNGLMIRSFTDHFRNDENKNSAAKASSAK
jgi:hypothetical protein